MSYFEECLTLGQWLSQEDRRALYKYLLSTNSDSYQSQTNLLLANGGLSKAIANGEIVYSLKDGRANYMARKLGSDEFTPVIREMKLTRLNFYNFRRLQKFFAQSEVDAIRNFPLPGANPQSESGFSVNANPYYNLSYYSEGKSLMVGVLRKIQTRDKELLNKLRAL